MKNVSFSLGLAVALTLGLAQSAFARPGGGGAAANSGMRNGGSMYGLCTAAEGNQAQIWMTQGYCRAVEEKLRQAQGCNGVSGNLVDTAMQKLPQEEAEQYCPGGNVKTDRNKFIKFFQQIVAALTTEESNWKDGGVSSMGARGLMQLSKQSVAGYKSCDQGCARIASSGKISGSTQANMDNMTCGTSIALLWLAKDGTLGKGSGNKGSRGIARYFQPYRDIDKVKRERMKNKVSTYCKQRLNQEPQREDYGPSRTLASASGANREG